jgi:5-methylcytosine-specific restriction endonuclease McrA
MWHWDQGRLGYFQFDNLKKIAMFALTNDLKAASYKDLLHGTGLAFPPDDDAYKPWRNYKRVFRVSMIASEQGGVAKPTRIAEALALVGSVTTDEYLHYLAEATTEPSPGLAGWNYQADMRFPLLFALKYLLAKAASGNPTATIEEIIGAFDHSGLTGEEEQQEFLDAIAGGGAILGNPRQARESLRVLVQISYLTARGNAIEVALSNDDAQDMFESLGAMSGPYLEDGDDEIERRANLFMSSIASLNFEYATTVIEQSAEAGFQEGSKVKKTHLTIERNGKLRKAFFDAHPTAVCDICRLDTNASFPWVDKVLDVHHLLPLASGTRTENAGTVLSDLVPLCPTCHRAVHRYYDKYLTDHARKDFLDVVEARATYDQAKKDYAGPKHV